MTTSIKTLGLLYAAHSDNGVEVMYHSYRTAHVRNVLLTLEDDENRRLYALVEALCKKAGRPMDNHIVLELVYEDGSRISMMWTDGNLMVGCGVSESRW